MRLPSKEELPLKATPQAIQVSEDQLDAFAKAFRRASSSIPPTFGAVALKGVFELIDRIEGDWKKLLHATQQFTYHRPLQKNEEIIAETRLMDHKFRASTHWLQFETQLRSKADNTLCVTSKSLILIRQEEASHV